MEFLNAMAPAIDVAPAPKAARADDATRKSDELQFEEALSGAMDRDQAEPKVDESEPVANEVENDQDEVEISTGTESEQDDNDTPLELVDSRELAATTATTGVAVNSLTPVDEVEPIQGTSSLVKPVEIGTVEPEPKPIAGDGRPVLPTVSTHLPELGSVKPIPEVGAETKPKVGESIVNDSAIRQTGPIPMSSEQVVAETDAARAMTSSTLVEPATLQPTAEMGATLNREHIATQRVETDAPPLVQGDKISVSSSVRTEIGETARAAAGVARSPELDPTLAESAVKREGQMTPAASDRPVVMEMTESASPRETLAQTEAAPRVQDIQPGNLNQVRPQQQAGELSGPRLADGESVAKSPESARPVPAMELPRQTLKIIQEMKSNAQNSYRAEIRLDPPELGKIRIELNMEGERTWARMVVESAAAREQVQNELPRIKELLASQGLEEARVEVQLRKEDAQEQQSGRDGGGNAGDSDTTVEDGTDGGVRVRRSEHDGLIDLRA